MYRPLELAYKYGNLSEGVCKPGYAAAKMTTIYPKWGGLPFLLHVISDKQGEMRWMSLSVLYVNLEKGTSQINHFNWMSAQEKLKILLKHTKMHDVIPRANLA